MAYSIVRKAKHGYFPKMFTCLLDWSNKKPFFEPVCAVSLRPKKLHAGNLLVSDTRETDANKTGRAARGDCGGKI
jgi:hypothetical protein